MNRHVVLFARAPQAGRVKRRLARDIGDLPAARFVRATLARQIAELARRPQWKLWLFITPDTQTGHPAWRSRRPVAVRPQGPGDLGERMLRPLRHLPAGPVVLVGSDIPEMRASHIVRAFRLLGRCDLVFGPASDGGFWLVGARRTRSLPCRLFSGVRWSSEHALADACANIPANLTLGLLDTLDDVDTGADFRRYLEKCGHGPVG